MIDAPWTVEGGSCLLEGCARACTFMIVCMSGTDSRSQRQRERERERERERAWTQRCSRNYAPRNCTCPRGDASSRGRSDGNYIRRNVEIIVLINGESIELYIGNDGDTLSCHAQRARGHKCDLATFCQRTKWYCVLGVHWSTKWKNQIKRELQLSRTRSTRWHFQIKFKVLSRN